MTDERSATGRPPIAKADPARRSTSGASQPGEQQVDHALRPRSLREMIGQARLRDKMQILVEAARKRGDAIDHVLL
ncbi:MAG: Holliday junction branch migration DNA helicase RuvB, partial [Caldilinea sp.]